MPIRSIEWINNLLLRIHNQGESKLTQYSFDPAHSNADFSVRHMMITTVRGGFKEVSGILNFDKDNSANSSVEATIKADSIWTGVADRDGHLKSPDFLDVANHPEITFKSTSVNMKGDDKADVVGDLTIRGVTNPVTLNVEFLGEAKNPFTGTATVGFTASTQINRETFGLTWNQALETGGVLVGKDIKITLDIEAVPAA